MFSKERRQNWIFQSFTWSIRNSCFIIFLWIKLSQHCKDFWNEQRLTFTSMVSKNYSLFSLFIRYTIAWQLFACMILEDTLFYWGHRLFHTDWFYKKFHSVHHQVQYTFSIACYYFHPVEFFVGIVIPVLVPALILRVGETK